MENGNVKTKAAEADIYDFAVVHILAFRLSKVFMSDL